MRSHQFILKYRLAIIIIFPLLTLFFALGLLRLEIEPDINDLIPADMASRVQTNQIDSVFGSNKLIIIVLETEDILNPATLERVRTLTRAFQRCDMIDRVTSLFTLKQITNDDGIMIVDPAVPLRALHTKSDREVLRNDLRENTLAYGTVVSANFNRTAILLTPDPGKAQNQTVRRVDEILEKHPGKEKVYTGGLPVVNATIISDIFKDVAYLLPIGFILMTLMLYLAFRQLRGFLLPFSVVLMAMILSFGLMPLLGWKIAIVTVLMPIMLIAVANDYGIHMVAKYNELLKLHPDWSKKQLAIETYLSLKYPVLITGLTTVVGILGLLAHVIVHARQLGILTSLGITWAVALSLLFIPAFLSYLPKKGPKKKLSTKKNRASFLERILSRAGNMIVKHAKKIVIISLLLAGLIGLGAFSLNIDGNIENFFKEKHPVKISSKIINDDFGGAQTLSVLFNGDIKNPELLARMASYQDSLATHPHIGKVTSIVDAIKEISKGLHQKGSPGYNKLPDTRNAVAQYLELYYMNGDPDDFEQLVDFDYMNAQMIIRINNTDGNIIRKVVRDIQTLTETDPYVSMMGGEAMITSEMNMAIVGGQIKSLILAVVAIILILMFVFRSPLAGFFASLPLLIAEIILFGLMGYFGVSLDPATALLSSVMIGVGVDYTIHFLWRYREEYHISGSRPEGVRRALLGSGKGIVFNAWSVIMGFAALFFSTFLPIQYFGFLVVISISVCLIAALILMPAMCLLFKPSFLEKKESL